MHLHLPTDTTMLIAAPIAGIVAAVIFMIIFNIIQDRSNHAWIWQIAGAILMLASLIIGGLLPFIS